MGINEKNVESEERFLMSEKLEYTESLNAFVELYNEQQNKIKSILNDTVSSLSIKIPSINIPQASIPQVDIKPLEAKGIFANVDTVVGQKLKGAFDGINAKGIIKMPSAFDNISLVTEKLADMCNTFTEDFKSFLNNAGIIIRENLLFNLSVLGELEWCYLEIEELDDSELLDLAPSYLKEYLNDNEHSSIKDIDEYVTKFFYLCG